MPKRSTDPRLWKSVSAALADMDEKSLRKVIHDLYKLSPENRAFLASLIGDQDSTELLRDYKAKITAEFFVRGKPRYSGMPNLTLCRRLINDYQRITSAPDLIGGFDIPGTFDLSLHYMETIIESLKHIGWDDPKPYDSMDRVAENMVKICQDPSGRKWAGMFVDRTQALDKAGQRMGWSMEDTFGPLADTFAAAAAEFEAKPDDEPQ